VVQRRQSCFTSLAARPLSAARSGCLAFLVALLWLCGTLPAHALRSPLPPPDRAAIGPTSPVETRIGDFSFMASGRLSLDREPGAEIAAGCDACAYETASGQRRWLNRDPMEDAETVEGPNLYLFVGNDPLNWIDPDGLRKIRTVNKQTGQIHEWDDTDGRITPKEIAGMYGKAWAETAAAAAGGEALGAAGALWPKVCKIANHNRYFRLGKGWVPEAGANEFRAAFGGRDKFIHGHIDSSNWYKPWNWFQKIGRWKNYD
jgi:RHS repeat-associated protein